MNTFLIILTHILLFIAGFVAEHSNQYTQRNYGQTDKSAVITVLICIVLAVLINLYLVK